jgi:L-ascorbate metabolism protein UlaG (beta-lactamase superfamily)
MNLRAPVALVGAVLLTSCLSALGPGVSELVDTAPGDPDPVRLVYLGSGGWIMQHRDEMVMAGPLFSNPGIFKTGILGIRSDTAVVNEYMTGYDSTYDVSRTSAILVGHAHYDHLMDVPQVARRFAPEAEIVASRTSRNILGTWSGVGDRVRVVNDGAGDQRTTGEWLRYGERTRVMALRSHHAPHFDGYTLYRGTRETPMTEEPSWATDWVEGRTFAFLVDFMSPTDPDSVAFRIYYQDAVAPPPAGFAPDEVVRERPVDVAILVPATFDQVDWHPEAFIENLRPRSAILGHWEDFFGPMDEPTKAIFLTDLRHFERRLERVYGGPWWRPEKGTEFLFAAR